MPRFSFSFLRLFRFRTRASKEGAKSFSHARRQYLPEVMVSGKPDRTPASSSYLKPTSTTAVPPKTCAVQSPVAAFSLALTPITEGPTSIVIEQDAALPSHPLSPKHSPSPIDVGSPIYVNDVSLSNQPERHVALRGLPVIKQLEDRPDYSPISMCSTLVYEEVEGHTTEAAPDSEPDTLSHQLSSPKIVESGPHKVVSVGILTEDDVNVPSGSGRVRPVSLFSPRPVRVKMSRFSLPTKNTTPIMVANRRDERTRNNRVSLASRMDGPGFPKKEKRVSRWSRELHKPETQEMMKMLANAHFP